MKFECDYKPIIHVENVGQFPMEWHERFNMWLAPSSLDKLSSGFAEYVTFLIYEGGEELESVYIDCDTDKEYNYIITGWE